MGVNPEPAHRADDASRLVPCVSSLEQKAVSALAPLARGLAALTATVTLLAATPQPACAYESTNAQSVPIPMMVRADLRPAGLAAEWGGTALLGQDGSLTAPIERMQATFAAPRPDGDDEILRFGDMSVPRLLVETILKASEETGVDPVYMMALADKESSFDTTVKSSASSAQGLFQFVTGTWLEMIRQYGAKHGLADEAAAVKGHGSGITIADAGLRKRVLDLRNDPYISGLMAGELIKRDRSRIEARIGRELKTTELYLAHFLGTASAGKFLSLSAEDPEKVAKAAFGRAARANRAIFTQREGGKRRSLTVAEVHEKLDGMIDRRLSQYQAIADLAAQQAEAPAEPILDARLRINDSVEPSLALHSVQ